MGMHVKTMWQTCGAIVVRSYRFGRSVPLTFLAVAVLLVLPQVMYPLHLAQHNHSAETDHDGCCHALCAPAPQDKDASTTPSLMVSEHNGNDCTLCLAYNLTGGYKTLRAAPFRCSLPPITRMAFTQDTVAPSLSSLAHCTAPRAPPLLFVS